MLAMKLVQNWNSAGECSCQSVGSWHVDANLWKVLYQSYSRKSHHYEKWSLLLVENGLVHLCGIGLVPVAILIGMRALAFVAVDLLVLAPIQIGALA